MTLEGNNLSFTSEEGQGDTSDSSQQSPSVPDSSHRHQPSVRRTSDPLLWRGSDEETEETEEDSVDGDGDEIKTSVNMSDPNQVQDLEQMRQLAITAQRELEEARQAQGAVGGGQQQTRGVVLRLPAPSLDDVGRN